MYLLILLPKTNKRHDTKIKLNEMETNKILEGNKILAEFMGRCGKRNKNLYWVNIPGVLWVAVDEMKFHSSWDWLMPVVEKIESLNYSTEIYSMGSYNHRMVVYSSGAIVNQSELMESKIKSVFTACVEFAKWYKNQY